MQKKEPWGTQLIAKDLLIFFAINLSLDYWFLISGVFFCTFVCFLQSAIFLIKKKYNKHLSNIIAQYLEAYILEPVGFTAQLHPLQLYDSGKWTDLCKLPFSRPQQHGPCSLFKFLKQQLLNNRATEDLVLYSSQTVSCSLACLPGDHSSEAG